MGDVHPTELKVRLCEELGALTFGRWLGYPGEDDPGQRRLRGGGSGAENLAACTAGQAGVIAFSGGLSRPGLRCPGRQRSTGVPGTFPEPAQGFCRRSSPTRIATAARSARRPPTGWKGSSFPELFLHLPGEAGGRGSGRLSRSRPVGCILVEPAQGRGGDVFPPLDFLRLLRAICATSTRSCWLFDEIYTGFHRTGALFACDHSRRRAGHRLPGQGAHGRLSRCRLAWDGGR